MWPAARFLLVLGITLLPAATLQQVANDVVSDYAEVKQLLTNYYRRAARRFGHDDSPIKPRPPPPSSEKTEAGVNYKIWDEVFENDIILTLPQAEVLLSEKQIEGNRHRRQIHPNSNLFWTNTTISYEFTNTQSDRETWAQRIRNGLRHIESLTCIRFKENGTDSNRLRYFRGSGCWSNVGMIGGSQWVSIGYGCDGLGIVAHETLHALGLWHEQSRYDRDYWIEIEFDNILKGTQGNFEKRDSRSAENLGQPYDIGSVMHYGSKAFSIDWSSYTIKARDPIYQRSMGQREGLSFKDAKMINLRYCSRVCPYQLPCYNNGYTDPNNCGTCRCPRGYGGTYCERALYTTCGSELKATYTPQTLESGFVKANAYCIWRISAPAGWQVRIKFDKVSFPCGDPCTSYVEVKYAADKTASGGKLCCDYTDSIVSQGGDILLYFRGEAGLQDGYHGFSLTYQIDGQPTTTPAPAPATRATARPSSSYWGSWGQWGVCSRSCGGCGIRRRQRECYGGNRVCTGEKVEAQYCNTQVCQTGQRNIVCNGRILLPCDMLDKLDFGQKSDDLSSITVVTSTTPQPLPTLPNSLSNYIIKHNPERKSYILYPRNLPLRRRNYLRRKRAIDGIQKLDGNICEKKFSYQCPTSLLTVHLNWKNTASRRKSNSKDQRDSPLCCEGYYQYRGYCYKRT